VRFAFLATISSIAFGSPARLDVRLRIAERRLSTPAPAFEPSLARQKGLCLEKPVDTDALIRSAAEKHRVPASVHRSIIAAESNFKCDAISPRARSASCS